MIRESRTRASGPVMHASTQLLRLEGGKPALDEIEPRGVRREVRMKARVPGEPSADQRGLVRPVVVHDDVHVQVGRYLDIEGGQEGAKLDRAMPPTNLTQHVSRLHFQCGKERRRPVPFVVVGPPFSLARAQGEQRRRAIQGLDLWLFVDAEDRGVLRRIEIQPHDVADLVDEQRIRRQLEGLRATAAVRKPARCDAHSSD